MRKEIIIEFERVKLVYHRWPPPALRCKFCRAKAEPLTLKEATLISSAGEVCEFAKRGKLHVFQSASGEKLICLASLLDARSREADFPKKNE